MTLFKMAIDAFSYDASASEITIQAPSPTSLKSASSLNSPATSSKPDIITKFTNCRLLRSTTSSNPSSQCATTYKLVEEDLWISSLSGTILDGQQVFYDLKRKPDVVVDLGGKIISPGFIDMQLNGGFGINFSDVPQIDGLERGDQGEEWMKEGGGEGGQRFKESLEMVNKRLIPTGVTSYLPTLTSQKPEVYHKVRPFSLLQGYSLKRRSQADNNSYYHILGHQAETATQEEVPRAWEPTSKALSFPRPRRVYMLLLFFKKHQTALATSKNVTDTPMARPT